MRATTHATTHAHPAPMRPATTAAQDRAAVAELCKAVDHLRDALFFMPDSDSDLAIATRHALRTIKESISIATNGTVLP